jgi:hypothetical protein
MAAIAIVIRPHDLASRIDASGIGADRAWGINDREGEGEGP